MAKAPSEPKGPGKPSENTLRSLLHKLRILRLAAGWTQERFSELAGLSYKYYQAVEAGRKRDLRLSTLERLARAHGLEVWELLAPDRTKASNPKAIKKSRPGSRQQDS